MCGDRNNTITMFTKTKQINTQNCWYCSQFTGVSLRLTIAFRVDYHAGAECDLHHFLHCYLLSAKHTNEKGK